MANLCPGGDYSFATNPHPPLICDPYPTISKVWSINNPSHLLTPESVVVEEGEMETGDEGQEEPLPPRLKVQLPTRQSFLANGVHQLELILLYGDLEEHVLLIDIHGDMTELPIQKPSESEIPISDNSSAVPINSFPCSPPPPISNHGDVAVVKEALDDPLPPPRKKITPRRKKLKESTTCKICHKKFANKSDAAKHSFIHLNQEEKEAVKERWKNKCYFCAKRFRDQAQLDVHLLVHTEEKPHPCDKCRKKFTQKSGLTRHQRHHTQDPAIRRPFNCTECAKGFTEKQSLTRHVTTVHLRLKEFQCPECDQKFGRRNTLTTHLNGVHLGIRYPCRKANCDKSFSFTRHRRRHEKQAH